MARQVVIGSTTITPTKKPIEVAYENDDRGGSDDIPNVRAGVGKRIKFEACILDSGLTSDAALALITAQDSEGDTTVTATLFDASTEKITYAVVDVSIEGDGAQVAAFDCIGRHST